jgi:hypothetical protein
MTASRSRPVTNGSSMTFVMTFLSEMRSALGVAMRIAPRTPKPQAEPASTSSARSTGACCVMARLLNMKSRGRLTQSAAMSSPVRR